MVSGVHVSLLRRPKAQPSPWEDGSKVSFHNPEQSTVSHILTGAEANESLFTSVKASDPPLSDGAKVFAINTT